VAEGLSNKGIAKRLGLSRGTVNQYVLRISKRIPGIGPPRFRIMAWYYREQQKAA
jgi:FixJ family two-component response regulator